MGIRRLTVRLDTEKTRDREIISYLENFDKKELRTMNNAVLNAVYEFLKSKDKSNSEKSKNFISEIISEIRKAISEEFSKFYVTLFGAFANNQNISFSDNRKTADTAPETEDVDMDFLGE